MGDRRIGPHEAEGDDSPTEARPSAPDEETSRARWDDDGGHGLDATSTAVASAPSPKGGLFLRGVLDSALPPALGTDEEPERYTVAAVFSRRVLPEEQALIESPDTVAALATRGYPGVRLKVADRRLEISQTSLAMLVGGLASRIAALLRDVEQQVITARERRDDERVRGARRKRREPPGSRPRRIVSVSSDRPVSPDMARRSPARRVTRDYAVLAKVVRESGLHRRRYAYYWTRLLATVAAFGLIWVGILFLGDTWWQLVLAAALAVVLAQLAFLGHDSSHRQIFRSHAWNDWTGRILANAFVGLSHTWWTVKHDAHHTAPNQEARDPDISSEVIAFTPASVASRRGWRRWFARRQGWFFVPLLTLEGLNLHVASMRAVLGRRSVVHRGVEVPVLLTRLILNVAVLVILLPPAIAGAFLAVQLAVFGVLLGGAFAPNHKGMPIVPADADVDFLRRQVLMSRNIRGNVVIDFFMGGLNRQIEHHLFPSMPRPSLRHVQPFVREYCTALGVKYTEVGFFSSYRIVIGYLNDVEHRARDPFGCPLAARLGR